MPIMTYTQFIFQPILCKALLSGLCLNMDYFITGHVPHEQLYY